MAKKRQRKAKQRIVIGKPGARLFTREDLRRLRLRESGRAQEKNPLAISPARAELFRGLRAWHEQFCPECRQLRRKERRQDHGGREKSTKKLTESVLKAHLLKHPLDRKLGDELRRRLLREEQGVEVVRTTVLRARHKLQ